MKGLGKKTDGGSLLLICLAAVGFLFGTAGSLLLMTADYGPGAVAEAASAEGAPEKTVSDGQGSKEKNMPVLVIDAGHGGFDGGAEAADGTKEKDINLAIARELKKVAKAYPIRVIMTREEDTGLDSDGDGVSKKREDLLERNSIMEEAAAGENGDVLPVSIHLNSYPQDASVYGAQVFYPSDEQSRTGGKTGERMGEHTSRDLAESVQKSLETSISDGRERTAMDKNDILIFREPPCRIILVECGFLSNQKEAKKLQTAEYQQRLAEAIWKGINEILCLDMEKKLPITDSANKPDN